MFAGLLPQVDKISLPLQTFMKDLVVLKSSLNFSMEL